MRLIEVYALELVPKIGVLQLDVLIERVLGPSQFTRTLFRSP